MKVLKWLRQSRRVVTFSQNAIDQALLAAIQAELSRQPGRSFNNLCKEALHQFLVQGQTQADPLSLSMEEQMANLQAQVLSLEQRFFTKEKNRLERLEAQVQQLTAQVAQLGPVPFAPTPSEPAPEPRVEPEDGEDASGTDPLLTRLGNLIDDF